MSMHVADERLLTSVHELDRPIRPQREHRPVDLHREILAAAEGAADAREVQPHLVGREIEAGRHLVAVYVEPLCGHVDVDAALAVRDAEARFGTEERLVLHADLVLAGDGHLSLCLWVAMLDHEVAEDVRPGVVAIGVPHRRPVRMQRLRPEGTLGVDDRVERLVLDTDALGGAARLLRVLGRDDRNRLAEVADPLEREHRLVRELEPVAPLAGHVLVRQHRVHAGQAHRFRDVDRRDPRVRVRAAHGRSPEHAGRVQVARIRELAGDLRNRVAAEDRLPHAADLETFRRRRHRPAAVLTASKIFW
jgi:hypothetical protein